MARKTAYLDPVRAEAQKQEAAAATLDRIDRDLVECSWRVRELLRKIRKNLFDAEFDVNALHGGGVGYSGSEAATFHREMGESSWDYITKARLETAMRLVRDTALRVEDIAALVGYWERGVFSKAFKRWTGLTPEGFRRRWSDVEAKAGRPPEDIHTVKFLEDRRRGQFEAPRARGVLAFLEAVDGVAGEGLSAAEDRLESGLDDQLIANQELAGFVWEWLAKMPSEYQHWLVGEVIYLNSSDFFRLLLRKCDEVGRNDPRQGLELAVLALEHLECSGDGFAGSVESLRALGLGWLAAAHRRLNDYSSAARNFAYAWESWELERDQQVEAELCTLEGTFYMFQRRYDEALRLLSRAIGVAQAAGDSRLLVAPLLQRVSIVAYTGNSESTIPDLHFALRHLAELDEPYLTLAAYGHLAIAYTLVRKPSKALEILPKARKVCEQIKEVVAEYHLKWVEGLAREALGQLGEAETLFEEARAGFVELGVMESAAIISLNLAILNHHHGRHFNVLRLAAEAIPVFESLGIPDETLAAVTLLRKAIAANKIDLEALEGARALLTKALRDPAITGPLSL